MMMPDPAIDRATAAVGELSTSVRALTNEVVASEGLRTEKIRWIQRLLYVLVPCVLLLIVMAITNFIVINRTSNTNELLLGCFQPGTACSEGNTRNLNATLEGIRQTQFVIAICQRLNPITEDADGSKVVACVQDYYPSFHLPTKAK